MANGKTYLIQFLATVQGSQIAVKDLKQLEHQIDRGAKTTKKATGMQQQYIKALQRVMVVVPMWMLFRGIIRGITSSIRFLITTTVELDDELSRIRTVMHGTGTEIEAQMIAIKQQILDTASNSRLSIKELAEGFYFLKTSNLDAKEAMSAFDATVNLAVGTQNSMAESARAVAGIYNTMGKYLGDNLSIHEKFQKISDVLAYTYATQDVQLSELIQSYTKLAPYVTGLSDGFTELTTMLGFLNTHLLRGGRTGRLTGRAILQLTKNAQKLANQFGITFKGNEPIDLLGTIGKIHDKMQQTGKMTAQAGQQIQEVFATRAGVAIRLLLENWDDLSEQIKEAMNNVDGFAQKMNEIRMNTIAGQTARMKNIFASLFQDFMTGFYNVKNISEALRDMGDALKDMQPVIKETGVRLGWLYQKFADYVVATNNFKKAQTQGPGWQRMISQIYGLAGPLGELAGAKLFGGGIESPSLDEYRANVEKGLKIEGDKRNKLIKLQTKQNKLYELANRSYKKGNIEASKALEDRASSMDTIINDLMPAENQLAKVQETKQKNIALIEENRIGFIDKYNEETKHSSVIMKEMGASSLAIAKYELERLRNTELISDESQHNLDILKAENKVTQETLSNQRTIIDMLINRETQLLELQGIRGSNLVIAKNMMQDILLGRGNEITQLKRLLETEQAITKEKIGQRNLSSESIKLYRIAQKYGVGVASSIAEVLRATEQGKGYEALKNLLPGTEISKVFEEQFADIEEQIRAQEFFFGNREQFGGYTVPITERPERFPIEEIRKRAQQIQQITQVSPTIPIDIKIQVDSNKITSDLVETIRQKINQNKSSINQAIHEVIEKF